MTDEELDKAREAAARVLEADGSLEVEERAALAELLSWTGSKFLSGEQMSRDDETDCKSKLYSFLCRLIGWFHPAAPPPPAIALEHIEREAYRRGWNARSRLHRPRHARRAPTPIPGETL